MRSNAQTLSKWQRARWEAFRWRIEASVVQKLMLSAAGAVFVGLMAQVRVPLPWSPVPITGQTFGVLLAAVLLGRTWGGISMGMYICAGLAGIPWFSSGGHGLGALAGPTGGYLIGFVVAALAVGYLSDRYARARGLLPMFAIMAGANFLIIHGLGLLQLGIYLALVQGKSLALGQLLWMGTVPFIPGDLVKALAAASAARAITAGVPLDRQQGS